jgi:Rrf2 family iron-sulfur cluster assembly transcriptional regulator
MFEVHGAILLRINRSENVINTNLHESFLLLHSQFTSTFVLTGVHFMRLSTRGRFAITAMIDLALREAAVPVPLQDLAQRHRISMSYLEQMFAKLRQHGLVDSTRGPGGGYTLALAASSISVADIIGAIEDETGERPKEPQRETSPSAQAMTQDLWDALQTTVANYLKTVSLQSLADEQKAKGFQVQERKTVQKGVFQKPRPPVARPGTPNSVFALGNAWPVRG